MRKEFCSVLSGDWRREGLCYLKPEVWGEGDGHQEWPGRLGHLSGSVAGVSESRSHGYLQRSVTLHLKHYVTQSYRCEKANNKETNGLPTLRSLSDIVCLITVTCYLCQAICLI